MTTRKTTSDDDARTAWFLAWSAARTEDASTSSPGVEGRAATLLYGRRTRDLTLGQVGRLHRHRGTPAARFRIKLSEFRRFDMLGAAQGLLEAGVQGMEDFLHELGGWDHDRIRGEAA